MAQLKHFVDHGNKATRKTRCHQSPLREWVDMDACTVFHRSFQVYYYYRSAVAEKAFTKLLWNGLDSFCYTFQAFDDGIEDGFPQISGNCVPCFAS